MRLLLLLPLLLFVACASHRPCMTGFELGINGGRIDSPIRNFDSTYAGGHATIYFDTTGSCSVPNL